MARRPHKKHPVGPRRTPEERAQLFNAIQTGLLEDLSVTEISEKVNVPVSTIYKWLPRTKEIYTAKFIEFFKSTIDIDKTINDILKLDSLDRIRKIEELFKLIVWIRWPKEPRNHWLGMVRCISAYMRDQHGPVTINKADEAILNLLSRYLRADLIELMFSMEAPFPPDFEIVTNGTKYSDDIDFAARLINIILQKNIDLKDGSIAVSLNLVSVLLEKNFFGKNWFMSRTKFHKLWTDRSPSLPFMFVERYHSGLDLTIDPKHPTFKDAVDELLQQPDQIRDYLARCKWVIARLGDQLDPRALRRIPFPRFPAELTPIEAPCSPLKAEELVRIATIIDPSKLLI